MGDIVERLLKHAAIESNELEDDLYAAANEIERLRAALEKIAAIKNNDWGGDWEEIDHAREIANATLSSSKA